MILSCSSFYISNYRRVYYSQFFSESHTEVIIYAGNYFNQIKLEEETVLLVEKIDYEYELFYDNYYLLSFSKLRIIYYNYSSLLNYTEFKITIKALNAYYGLFNLKYYSNNFRNNFTKDFDIKYRNEEDWIFVSFK
jgi:hypothetical protein